jgi:phage tail-like protein
VEIDGVPVAGVRAVSPGSVTITDGGVGTPAVVDAGNITLALDPGADPSIHAWFRDLAAGKDIRKSITVILRVPRQPERRYTYHECWPCRWESAVLDSGSDTFIVEELEFAVERVERG